MVDAWELHYPGTRKALDRLTVLGFAAHQSGVVVDVRTGEASARTGKPVARYRLTGTGKKFSQEIAADIRVLEDRFPKVTAASVDRVAAFIVAFHLEGSHAQLGMSVSHATALAGLPERSGRWWAQHLVKQGLLRRLDTHVADTREIVPEHWRITRGLCRQLTSVLNAYPERWGALAGEFKLKRSRFLRDIDPARVGITGATDFDHDVEAQRICALLLAAPTAVAGGAFKIEPSLVLAADLSSAPARLNRGRDAVFYSPDAVLTERRNGVTARVVVEYERYQSRRDGWSHIERFYGWVAATLLPFEPVTLRFVLDSPQRLRGYVELIEAFADYALDHPERIAPNPTVLMAATAAQLRKAADPMDPHAWFSISVQPGSGTDCVLHNPDSGPYDAYFGKGTRG
jgi:hypothetical protein